MGHSAGSKVHATYTHIELPVKREAIRKLEAWVEAERLKHQEELQGGPHGKAEAIHERELPRNDAQGLSGTGGGSGGQARTGN
jgi:hypothetical protein